jgi:hypothetical protein
VKNKIIENTVREVETTIGELVEMLTKIALENGTSENEGYKLASLALGDLLKDNVRARELLE